MQDKHWSGCPRLQVAQGALHWTVTVMPELSESMRPPELVRVSSLKEELATAVEGFCRFVISKVKSRGG